jgi:hypothetical protein
MRVWLRSVALAVICALPAGGHLFAQTVPCSGVIMGSAGNPLRDVLQAFCIQSAAPPFDLNQRVQYAGFNSDDEFLLAYQTVGESGQLNPRVQVARLDKREQQWSATEFAEIKTEILPGLTAACFGAVEDLEKIGAFFYLSIHLSPSAGCVAAISDDLKIQKVFSGWIEAKFSNGAVVLAGSTVHFAPTHSLRLSLFDPADGSVKSIYPVEKDPLRARYIQRLRTEIAPADRCDGENCESDPEHFDDELADICQPTGCKTAIAVNDEAKALAFIVQFSPIGFIRFDEVKGARQWDEKVVFVYRFVDGGVERREFPISAMQDQFGVGSIDALLLPETLKRVFAP